MCWDVRGECDDNAVIILTMFQIQCQIVSVFHQRGMAGYLSVGGRVEFVLLDVQEAGHGKYIYMGGAPTPASSAPSLSCPCPS